jgi:hypothetical protein
MLTHRITSKELIAGTPVTPDGHTTALSTYYAGCSELAEIPVIFRRIRRAERPPK